MTATSTGGNLDYARFFAGDFLESRERFAALAQGQASAVEVVKGATEDEGFAYARFGSPQARHIVLHIAGTHGVEFPTGGAIQLAAVHQGISFQDDTSLIFIHGLNAWGARNLRRVTRNNVDLNRNFTTERSINSPLYSQLGTFINPKRRADLSLFYPRALMILARYGYKGPKTAIASGQYYRSDGLFFGGSTPEPVAAAFEAWAGSQLGHAASLRVLDFHTGLGRYGEATFIDDIDDASLKRVIPAVEVLSPEGQFYPIRGNIVASLRHMSAGRTFHGLTQEIGTLRPIRVLKRLREENFTHQHDRGSPRDQKAKKALLDVFAPQDLAWRRSAVAQGLAALQALAAWQPYNLKKVDGPLRVEGLSGS